MTITAKFAGRCNRCGGAIRAGEKIEWVRGGGSAHVACGTSAAPAPTRKTREPSIAGTKDGAVATLFAKRDGRPVVAEEMGRVFRAGKRAGEVAGKVVVVIGVEVGRYVNQEDADDFGDCTPGYPLTTYVRLATDEEAAPVAAAEAARETVRAARSELGRRASEAQAQNHDTYPPREDGGQSYDIGTGTVVETVTVYADGHAVWYHGGYHDDYRSSWGVTQDGAEVVALCVAAGIAPRAK